jgi:phosphoglucomutase
MLMDVDQLIGAYYDEQPGPSDPLQPVSFGTSGHRGSSPCATFDDEQHLERILEQAQELRGR